MDREAAITWGGIAAALGASIALLRSFGVGISIEQETALLKAAVVVLPLVAALIIRGNVWSKKSVEAKVAESFEDGKQGAAEPPAVI